MKNATLLIPALLSLVMAFGCASKNDSGGGSSPVTDPGNGVGGNGDPGTDYWANESGASVQFVPTSLTTMSEYVASHPLNNPTNFRLYVDLEDVGSGRWGGTVKIGYWDNGQLYQGTFSTDNPNGNDTNRVSYKDWYKGKSNAEFNQWFGFNGKTVFHGFFQDGYGAIVLVIDGGLDLGDGGGLTEVSGSVYFKNFRVAPAPQYMGGAGEMCWFLLSPSPYECGTFKYSSGKVVTTSALYPKASDGYKKLGTFTGMSKTRAFRE